MLQIGKMYLVKELFGLLFPTKELVGRSRAASWVHTWVRDGTEGAMRNAKWFSESYKCNVFVVEPNTCVVLLEVDDNHFKLLDSNGNIGWIYCWDFSRYFELVKAKQ